LHLTGVALTARAGGWWIDAEGARYDEGEMPSGCRASHLPGQPV